MKQNEGTEKDVPNKERDKTPNKNFNEMEVNNLPDKECKVRVMKLLTQLGRRMGEHRTSSKKQKI